MTSREQLDENIEEIVDRIRTYKADVERLESGINALKAELRRLLEDRGENWSDEDGYARIISEGERTNYDTSALDRLIIEDPLRYGWLKDYRITSTVQSRVQVK